MSQKILIICLIFVNFIFCINANNCLEVITNQTCKCEPLYGMDPYITCPLEQHEDLAVFFQKYNTVQVECSKDDYDLTSLANVAFVNISSIYVKNCQLSRAEIQDMFAKLETSQPTKLKVFLPTYFTYSRLYFNKMQSLKELIIMGAVTHEKRNEFTADFFTAMPNLTKLELTLYIKEFPRNLFAPLHNLRTLYLETKNDELPAGIFSNQSQLSELTLVDSLTSLNYDVFQGASGITRLTIKQSSIEKLQPKTFSLLPNLSILDLYLNNFVELPEGIFSNNRRLTNLELVQYNTVITTLPNGLLANLSSFNIVRILCGLEDIPADTFANSSAISKIYLKQNKITVIPGNLLWDLENLVMLDLSQNRIASLPVTLFKNNKKLKMLILSENMLHTVSSKTFQPIIAAKNSYLLDIDFYKNEFSCDCNLLNLLGDFEIKKSDILFDRLQCHGDEEYMNQVLWSIQRERFPAICPMENCPPGCDCWRRTKNMELVVNCTNANLHELPNLSHLDNHSLRTIELHLENNKFLELPNNLMPNYEKVTKIYASGNNISKVDLHNFPLKLEFLDLSGNNLTALNENVLNYLNRSESLVSLTLSDNPWTCSCELQDFLHNHTHVMPRIEDIKCSHMEQILKFIDIKKKDICPGMGTFEKIKNSIINFFG